MLVCKIRFTHNITNRKMILVVTEKQIFHIEDTDHVVGRIFIDWQPGKLILLKNLNQLIVGTVYLRKGHIDSRNHDFFGLCIAKIKHIVNHGVFFRLDDAWVSAFGSTPNNLQMRLASLLMIKMTGVRIFISTSITFA